DVAGADRLLERVESLEIGAGRNLRLERADRRAPAGAAPRQPLLHLARWNRLGSVEQSEPHERSAGTAAAAGKRRQLRLQSQAGLVSEVASQRASRPAPCRVRRFEHRQDIFGPPRDEYLAGVLEQPRRAGALR